MPYNTGGKRHLIFGTEELFQASDRIVLFAWENNALKTHPVFLLSLTSAADGSNVTMGLTMCTPQLTSQEHGRADHLLEMLVGSH